MAPYVGAPEIKARRLVLAVEYHGQIGNPGMKALQVEAEALAALHTEAATAGARIDATGGPTSIPASMVWRMAVNGKIEVWEDYAKEFGWLEE